MYRNPVTRLLQLRLLAAVESLRQDVTRYVGTDRQHVPEAIKSALDDADYYAQEGQFLMGWNKLFLAEQQAVQLMTEDQRAIKADNLRIEAVKLSGWRQDQIYHLLGRPDADPGTLRIRDKDRLIEALKIRNDFYNTRNHRMLLRRANLNAVTIALLVILVAVLLLSLCYSISEQPRFGAATVIYSLLFGALGASFSMANTISTSDMAHSIPDQLQGIYNIIIRLAVGATAGCVVFLLFLSGLFNCVFSDDLQRTHSFFLVLAFLAGFSERWVVNLLSGLVQSDKNGAGKKS